MILNSVLGSATKAVKRGIAATVFHTILHNEKRTNSFFKIMNNLVERVARGVDWLAQKMTKKKTEFGK